MLRTVAWKLLDSLACPYCTRKASDLNAFDYELGEAIDLTNFAGRYTHKMTQAMQGTTNLNIGLEIPTLEGLKVSFAGKRELKLGCELSYELTGGKRYVPYWPESDRLDTPRWAVA